LAGLGGGGGGQRGRWKGGRGGCAKQRLKNNFSTYKNQFTRILQNKTYIFFMSEHALLKFDPSVNFPDSAEGGKGRAMN